MKESNIAKTWLPEWQKQNPGGRLFRNNTGMAWQGKNHRWLSIIRDGIKSLVLDFAKPIFYGIGLMKKSKKKGRKHPVGGGDYIGWTVKTLCDLTYGENYNCNNNDDSRAPYCANCKMLKKIAIFTSIEFKSSDVKETEDQIKFRKLVEAAGGITQVIKEGENGN